VGPLQGIRVVEIATVGPVPFCAMMLADLGAEVIRVDRAGDGPPLLMEPRADPLNRGRRSIAVDLKCEGAIELMLRLVERADVLVEGFRPGVAERLGIGPDSCRERNSRLVYGRVTGWGREGPLAPRAGHDIDFVALSGALHPLGLRGGPPAIPLNMVADFGGGGMLLTVGVLSALWERDRSGLGQVVDASMVDGAALLTTMIHGLRAAGLWIDERGSNLLDSGAPFYDVYQTADGGHMAVGALEPRFYSALLRGLGLDGEALPEQYDRLGWPVLRRRFSAVFSAKSRREWESVFAGLDACVAPVLALGEAPLHPHNVARGTFIDVDGVTQPAPAPRFGRTPSERPSAPPEAGEHTDALLAECGFTAAEVDALRRSGAVGWPPVRPDPGHW
jgi:alpha-methylacyl-CoA racemase